MRLQPPGTSPVIHRLARPHELTKKNCELVADEAAFARLVSSALTWAGRICPSIPFRIPFPFSLVPDSDNLTLTRHLNIIVDKDNLTSDHIVIFYRPSWRIASFCQSSRELKKDPSVFIQATSRRLRIPYQSRSTSSCAESHEFLGASRWRVLYRAKNFLRKPSRLKIGSEQFICCAERECGCSKLLLGDPRSEVNSRRLGREAVSPLMVGRSAWLPLGSQRE